MKKIATVALMALILVAVSQPALAAGRDTRQNTTSAPQAESWFDRFIDEALPMGMRLFVRVLISGRTTTPLEESTPVEAPTDGTNWGVGGCSPRAGVGGCKL